MDKTQNTIRNLDSDRVIVLKPMEGKEALSSTGMVDNRLFTRSNNLHCKMDKETSFWSFYMDHGILPQAFQQRFTSFQKAFNFAKSYYESRNIEIKEVVD